MRPPLHIILVAGGGLLLGSMLYFALLGGLPITGGDSTLSFGPGAFQSRLGTVTVSSSSVTFLPTVERPVAVAVFSKDGLYTTRYPYLQVTVDAAPSPAKLTLHWRSAAGQQGVHKVERYISGAGTYLFYLGRVPEWRDRIVDLGIAVSGPEFAATRISSVALPTPTLAVAGAAVFGEWSASRPWSQRSINFIQYPIEAPLLVRVPFAAAWSITMAGIVLMLVRRSRRLRQALLVMAIVVPWVFVDVLWLTDFAQKARFTANQFAGADGGPRAISPFDARLAEFASLARESLQTSPQRIALMVAEDPSDRFEKFRLRYHLLPHNVSVHDYSNIQIVQNVDTLDYLYVAKRRNEDVQYDASGKRLGLRLSDWMAFQDGPSRQESCCGCAETQTSSADRLCFPDPASFRRYFTQPGARLRPGDTYEVSFAFGRLREEAVAEAVTVTAIYFDRSRMTLDPRNVTLRANELHATFRLPPGKPVSRIQFALRVPRAHYPIVVSAAVLYGLVPATRILEHDVGTLYQLGDKPAQTGSGPL